MEYFDHTGAPRIHGELLKLGFEISEITVSRYMPSQPVDPDKVKRWIAFLRNHKDAIAAMDFFSVPTASLRMLYVFFVIEHGRRSVVHFNVTPNPTSAWVVQQLRESFPYDTAPKYLVFDRDTIFSAAVVRFVKAMGTEPTRTAYRCPWQNPAAERWVGSCRRELLEHVVILDERHLVRLIRSYVEYYHEHRRISAYARTLQIADRSLADLRPRPKSSHCLALEDSIIATNGVRPRNRGHTVSYSS